MVRAAWACVLLLVPEKVLRIGGSPPVPPAAIAVARVLGTRQLLQGAATAARPTPAVAALSAAVDTLHAGTDVGLAIMSPRWRRIALLDACIAAGLAAGGWRARAGRGR